MSATLSDSATDLASATCWHAVRLLAELVRDLDGPLTSCALLVGDEPRAFANPTRLPAVDDGLVTVVVSGDGRELGPPAAGETRYELDDLIVMRHIAGRALPAAVSAMVELYVPYCLAPAHARAMGRAFAVSHFAQSLDGRIATTGGDARWIGCDENQLHAHRMRALCDGILIGSHTLRTDRPALTVRHADGDDPVRIVVGNADDLDCLEAAGPAAIVLFAGDGDSSRCSSERVEKIVLPRTDGCVPTAAILEELYRNDILSVYIEGGATTTSRFLVEGNIDVLQLHISPMIIGPGISSFTSPSIDSVADSVRFSSHVYRSVGDGMMFVGRVAL